MLKWISILLIALVWGFYFINFGINGSLSKSGEVWGQFGDYVGGVINPLLTFITIFLLIKSQGLQQEANAALINQIKSQEKLENYKKFELRFFSLIEAQEVNFSKLRILAAKDEVEGTEFFSNVKVVSNFIELKSVDAVNFIDDKLGILVRANVEEGEIKDWLDSLDIDDHFFSIARRFYLIVKLIDEKLLEEDREEQYEALLNLSDIKILIMIIILCRYYEWDNILYINKSKILMREGLGNYIENYK